MTQQERVWLEKTANIIDYLRKTFRYTNASVEARLGDVFFDDACRYVDLVFELGRFSLTLRGIIKFSELSEQEPEKK